MTILNKKSTPWILAISSMLVLFLFVGYWNYATYKKEKDQLQDDVEIQLQLSYTEIKDSELTFFIKKQLTDTVNGNFLADSVSLFFDKHPMFSSFRKIQTNQPSNLNQEGDTTIIIGFSLDNSISDPLNKKISKDEVKFITANSDDPTALDFVNDSTDITIDIQQINVRGQDQSNNKFNLLNDTHVHPRWQTLGDTLVMQYETKINSDSGYFGIDKPRFNDPFLRHDHTSVDKTYALFKEKLASNKLPTDFKIVKNPKTTPGGLRVSYKTNEFGFTEWLVDIQNYQLYILNKMIPTLIFSIFLLGIIGLAFWTLLSNWIKQNRLVLVKNEFINNMTHELKTPIATVGVALEAISNFDLNTERDKAEEYLDISRNEINRLSLLVDKVLKIAAFDSKEVNLKSEKVSLDEVIQNTLASLKLHLESNNVKVNYSNDSRLSIIEGDQLHMRHIIHNIIDNAIKYTSIDPVLDIRLSEKNQNIQLSIKDNGHGIPKEYQNKIFDKFFRVPNNDKHDVKGHGLGLSYVRNVVERFKGKVTVESIENQGSEFILLFPKYNANV